MSELPYTTPLTNTPSDYQPDPKIWDLTGRNVELNIAFNSLSLGNSDLYEPMEIHMWLERWKEQDLLLFEEHLRLTLCRIIDEALAEKEPT
jgi:hypothetical protein